MRRKTAQQLLRLIINGVGLKTTLEIIANLAHQAALTEDTEHTHEDKLSPFHGAANTVWVAATKVHNEDLAGFRVETPKE
jgi:hypothetical protein